MAKDRTKIVIAITIFIVGAIVAGRALYRGRSASPAPEPAPIGFLPWDKLQIHPIEWDDPRTNEKMTEAIRDGVQRLEDLPTQGIDDLVARAASRIRATMTAAEADRLNGCRESDGAIDLSKTHPENLTSGLRPFAGWADLWNDARGSIEQIAVRRLPSMNEDDLAPFQSVIIGRSPLNAKYPPPPDDALFVEVAIPLLISRIESVGGTETVYWGVSYWYDESAQRWYPVDALTYASGDSRGIFPAPM